MELTINVNGIEYIIDKGLAKDQINKLGKEEAIKFWKNVEEETQEKFKAKIIRGLIEEIKEN